MTGSRAEYGLVYWLMREIRADTALALQLVVTGAHLSAEFGHTVDLIRDDGFDIDAEVDTRLAGDSDLAVARSMAAGVSGLADALDRLRPHIVVLLGDRYEILCAAEVALMMRIPIAHMHGGERTEGAIDDAIRHAITKMAQLHFVAAPEYARRVVQLGEAPERVFTVGPLGLDYIAHMNFLERTEMSRRIGIALTAPVLLVTYHPVTTAADNGLAGLEALLLALERLPQACIVVTGPNADPGHVAIAERLRGYAAAAADRRAFRTSLGQEGYLSMMRVADVVIGNSSSGIIEAPAIGTPTVNIGTRQKGRVRSASVIDCDEDADAIAAALFRALDPAFRQTAAAHALPPGGGVARRIVEVLRSVSLDGLSSKTFYDLPQART